MKYATKSDLKKMEQKDIVRDRKMMKNHLEKFHKKTKDGVSKDLRNMIGFK